jgi:hypothetical protein
MARVKREPIEQFNKKYIIDENTGCWNWIGNLHNQGYGRLYVEKKQVLSHQFSYEYFIGPLDKKLEVCHKCCNRKCVNPKHLRQDTRKSNSIDMVNDGNAKDQILKVEDVIEIKKALKNYYRGQVKDLADLYKVKLYVISKIKRGVTWAHLNIT